MLHEIILSLSGHPSPLLSSDSTKSTATILSPQEKALLSSVARLSDLHCKLLSHTDSISSKHPSSVCQAVATSIKYVHLAKFQRKILEVESSILRKDAGSVGAYNIVPLTAVVGQFSEWTRRLEWFWQITQFMLDRSCNSARLIDKLCDSMQTGYADIEEVSSELVKVAETAWLKQASSWILYGRLPAFAGDDFFVHQAADDEDYAIKPDLLPGFVTSSTASSILFIGQSLNHIRTKSIKPSSGSSGLLTSHLRMLSALTFPITAYSFSSVISSIRLSLSQNALQQLLPLSRILELLFLLHEFFLLGRGEFAMALITETDEKIRSRWRRADNLAHDKRDKMHDIVVKDGEVAAVLTRTWTAMSSLQGMNDEEDEQLELARELINLSIIKNPTPIAPLEPTSSQTTHPSQKLAPTPFNTLLLSVPTELSLSIPSPLDLFLSPADIHVYSSINAYLLSIRRAHLRLSDLWKITSLRRHHPTPPAPPYGSTPTGRVVTQKLRQRMYDRSRTLRSVWATSSAALFLLAETESYFQGEIVKGTWDGFHAWLTGEKEKDYQTGVSSPVPSTKRKSQTDTKPEAEAQTNDDDDLWSSAAKHPISTPLTPNPTTTKPTPPTHDPQTLTHSHTSYLRTLTTSLLLTTHPTHQLFTTSLLTLLQKIDILVALVHRIHSIWSSLDLEEDDGVVDAFSDFHKEEREVRTELAAATEEVKQAVGRVVEGLRGVDGDVAVGVGGEFGEGLVGTGDGAGDPAVQGVGGSTTMAVGGGDVYRPRKVGRVDRLLMKLDFGGWFDDGGDAEEGEEEEEGDDDDDVRGEEVNGGDADDE